MAFHLKVTISPADVGRRVTVRRALPEGFRDVVGVLETWENGMLSVRRRDGSLVEFPEKVMAAAKVVPG